MHQSRLHGHQPRVRSTSGGAAHDLTLELETLSCWPKFAYCIALPCRSGVEGKDERLVSGHAISGYRG